MTQLALRGLLPLFVLASSIMVGLGNEPIKLVADSEFGEPGTRALAKFERAFTARGIEPQHQLTPAITDPQIVTGITGRSKVEDRSLADRTPRNDHDRLPTVRARSVLATGILRPHRARR